MKKKNLFMTEHRWITMLLKLSQKYNKREVIFMISILKNDNIYVQTHIIIYTHTHLYI